MPATLWYIYPEKMFTRGPPHLRQFPTKGGGVDGMEMIKLGIWWGLGMVMLVEQRVGRFKVLFRQIS